MSNIQEPLGLDPSDIQNGSIAKRCHFGNMFWYSLTKYSIFITKNFLHRRFANDCRVISGQTVDDTNCIYIFTSNNNSIIINIGIIKCFYTHGKIPEPFTFFKTFRIGWWQHFENDSNATFNPEHWK